MLPLQENVSLLPYNTFHIDVSARYFVGARSVDDITSLLDSGALRNNRRIFLGGGSNILFTKNFDGLVVRNELRGIEVVDEDTEIIILKVQSGENWHAFVTYCVDRGYGGVENLSLIPGTVGAAPMQNIGAYGVEVKDLIIEVGAIELSTGKLVTFPNQACKFGYRESYFKHDGKDRFFISSVTLRLTKKNHRYNTSYGALDETLRQLHGGERSIKTISDSVIHIRSTKLPDPAVVGNAGSFFKNPSIPESQFEELRKSHPAIPGYVESSGLVKVPAGWMIEQCGWKGKRFSSIGVHPNQALVLVNYGGGTGTEIENLARKIQSSVKEKFNINLHPEVNII